MNNRRGTRAFLLKGFFYIGLGVLDGIVTAIFAATAKGSLRGATDNWKSPFTSTRDTLGKELAGNNWIVGSIAPGGTSLPFVILGTDWMIKNSPIKIQKRIAKRFLPEHNNRHILLHQVGF